MYSTGKNVSVTRLISVKQLYVVNRKYNALIMVSVCLSLMKNFRLCYENVHIVYLTRTCLVAYQTEQHFV